MNIWRAGILRLGEKGADGLWWGVKVLRLGAGVSLFKALDTMGHNENNRA